MATEPLSVFISYSRDSDQHAAWVTSIANALDARQDFRVVFDQYDLHAGKDLTNFMDRATKCDRIVVIATPSYVRKSEVRAGGVGYESSIISADILADQLSARVVPALRSGDDLPAFLKSKLYVDFRDDDLFDGRLRDLVAALLGVAPVQRPPKTEGLVAPSFVTAATVTQPQIIRGAAPAVMAAISPPSDKTEFFGPVELENVGDCDAFNIDIGDLSNRSQIARFGRVPWLRPREKVAVKPTIDGVPTRNDMPDLYAFAFVGQIGHMWDLAGQDRLVPKDELQVAADRTFVAPMRISYADARNRSWVTYCEFLLGRDHSGRQQLRIELRRIEESTL